jgi:hypothetical protein
MPAFEGGPSFLHRRVPMITTEVQYRATMRRLRQFDDALHNLEQKYPPGEHSKWRSTKRGVEDYACTRYKRT